MGALSYLKVEGIGNDFLLVDRLSLGPDELGEELGQLAQRAPALCDRDSGIGADGILVVTAGTDGAPARMIVINHDGSRPEMCGNGLRCVAHYVADRLELGERAFDVLTDAGALRCAVLERQDDAHADVSVDMGPARFGETKTPPAAEGRRFVDVSMGNPHTIAFVGPDEDPEQLARGLGPAIEVDPLYPDRTNVEFARVNDDGSLTLWVWERGCGITLACGTGACATAAAAVAAGHLEAETWIPVHLPGGTLRIRVPAEPGAGVQMQGPSAHGPHGEA